MKQLWSKNIQPNKNILAFTVGEDYLLDQLLVPYDCEASVAHAKMLQKIRILTKKETNQITKTLREIQDLHKEGNFPISQEQEDCHTAIEQYLTEKLGDTGKKIHTARSRNDQVLTALRLLYKDNLQKITNLTQKVMHAISSWAEKYKDILLPGFTHTRKAMPSSILLWSQAYVDAWSDDLKLINTVCDLVDQSPLGTGAGYGVPMKIDRKYTAKKLGFAKVQENPIYTQMSRGKFESSILHVCSQILFNANKLASDLILFSTQEFGYFSLPEEFTTGSSIMPQKKNPDVLELIRAKYHVINGYEMQVKNISGNLISGYSRDLQLTKKPTLEGMRITQEVLAVIATIFSGLKVNKTPCTKAMTKELFATHDVYRKVTEGVSFRDAYKQVAKDL